MSKKLKGYGSTYKVCYKHKTIIGGSVCSFGSCQFCKKKVASSCGGLPKLCDQCSLDLFECKYCRIKLK